MNMDSFGLTNHIIFDTIIVGAKHFKFAEMDFEKQFPNPRKRTTKFKPIISRKFGKSVKVIAHSIGRMELVTQRAIRRR